MNNYPEPKMEQPSDEDLMEMIEDGIALSTDGICEIDSCKGYGFCKHGYPSWILYLGYT